MRCEVVISEVGVDVGDGWYEFCLCEFYCGVGEKFVFYDDGDDIGGWVVG